ncbi:MULTISPECIES: hypothetical protein [Streptomyces]|uniref:hypothetical protein n=1 Tax=Streptomyces TaxID=1883 RepID=UPI001E3194E8|nr:MULTISPECIES: hypothetical protein [Streptomyces]
MDQELERAALVALLRRGDRSWPDLTDQVETVGSARDVLEGAPVSRFRDRCEASHSRAGHTTDPGA